MKTTRLGAIFAGAIVAGSMLGSAAAAQGPEMPVGEMSAEDRATIDAIAQGVLESEVGVPAVYIGVWDPERGAYVAAYGTADRETGRPASVEDTFRIGSISKTFTAAVILQLIDEGLLALDDTVADADTDLAARFPAEAFSVHDIDLEDLPPGERELLVNLTQYLYSLVEVRFHVAGEPPWGECPEDRLRHTLAPAS